MTDLVSVIIPCFQQGQFLPDAIYSLQSQSHRDWEALIIDDGSTDNTELISSALVQADSRIKYIFRENGGLSAARNTGLNHARGSWIQFLDADDVIECEKFEQQIKYLKENPSIDIVYNSAIYFTDMEPMILRRTHVTNGPDHDFVKEIWDAPGAVEEKLVESNILPVCAPLLRIETLKGVGFFNEDLRSLEDWEFWLRCALAGYVFQFAPLPKTMAYIRVHPASMSKNTERMRQSQFEVRLMLHNSIEFSKLRTKNFSHLMHLASNLNQHSRIKRFFRIYKDSKSINEKIVVVLSFFVDKGGPLQSLTRKLFPISTQKSIAKWIGRSI